MKRSMGTGAALPHLLPRLRAPAVGASGGLDADNTRHRRRPADPMPYLALD